MAAGRDRQLISIHPDELRFLVELEKHCYCDLKVANNTSHHVAFKVKTTSPKKYYVWPNTSVIEPWDACVIRVTLQPQREYPPDMQCKDKFLFQSVIVPPDSDVDLPADTFTRENSEKPVEERKLRVVYTFSSHGKADGDNDTSRIADGNSALQILMGEREAAILSTQQLQRELELLRRRRYRGRDSGFSIMFAFVVGLLGIFIGFILSLVFSPPSHE